MNNSWNYATCDNDLFFIYNIIPLYYVQLYCQPSM